jgi:hypothetical protein
MVDENTQTDELAEYTKRKVHIKEEDQSLLVVTHEKAPKSKYAWIPLENNVEQLSEPIQVDKTLRQKRVANPTLEPEKLKVPVEEFKIQKLQTKLDPDFNLLEICTRFLGSPVLASLDLTVLKD